MTPPTPPMKKLPPRRSKPKHVHKRILPPAPSDPTVKKVEATVQAVVFANAGGDFVILRAVDENDDRVVLKGALGHVNVGESALCTGDWKQHPEHGWSFQVSHAEVSEPQSRAGMAAYLASAVDGIGPVFAKAIVDTFGEKTFEMIDADPKVLYKVRTPGGVKMSTKKIRAVIDAWEDARAVRKVMVYLSSHGVTSGIATKIYKQYGDRALEILQSDPYSIVEIRGIGFKIADRIARNLNVPLESPKRIQAGIVFCLQEAESAGHCFLTETQLRDTAAEQLLLEDSALIDEQMNDLIRARKVILESAEHENRIYLPELFFIERRLAQMLRDMIKSEPAIDIVVPDRPAEGRDGFVPNDGQWQAIENALTSRISLITGLPGTGKTTLIKLLLDVLDNQPKMVVGDGAVYMLASPTGKAARRLTEASGREAKTIHRMLQWSPNNGGFLHDEHTPLPARFVVVDETSMVDLRLAEALVRSIGPSTHLILVGDADQLPPVGAGKVFDDMIGSRAVPSIRLTEIFRQAARSLIVRNAHRIVTGKTPYRNAAEACADLELGEDEIDDDFFFVQRDEAEEVAATIVEFAAHRIPAKYGLDPIRDILVLAPMKKGPCGLEELNIRLQTELNANGKKLGVKNFRVGDRVIQTRNDYNIEVMNGEVGVLAGVDAESGKVELDFGDRSISVTTSDLDTFLLAYAISVHRSQGSQAPAVVCATATSHFIMLTRSLINTAVTRAQKLCVCVGQQRAMQIAVRTVDSRKRNAALAERLR